MNTFDELLARINKGEDPMTIANEFAEVLNQAVEAKRVADEKAKHETEKTDRAQELLETVGSFIRDFYPDIWDDDFTAFTGADLVKAADEALAHTKQVMKALNTLQETNVKPNDPILDFLAKHDLA